VIGDYSSTPSLRELVAIRMQICEMLFLKDEGGEVIME
jgi:hypothetical protein